MRIEKVKIKNFRLLKDVSLSLEKRTTLIVGRNNSGKTSLTELFRRILSEKKGIVFQLEDFSLSSHNEFWKCYQMYQAEENEEKIRASLPSIEMQLQINYKGVNDFGPLGNFIIDLNPDCIHALINIKYELGDGNISRFFHEIVIDATSDESEKRQLFFKEIRSLIPQYFHSTLQAEDPNDSNNTREVEWGNLRSLIQLGCINAQRGLNDNTVRENGLLGKIFVSLFSTAKANKLNEEDQKIANKLQGAVKETQTQLDENFKENLQSLVLALEDFGYPGLHDPGLTTETNFDVEKLLDNHTKVRYKGVNGISLPEAFNGLGSRNLIFILLKLFEFFKEYQSKPSESAIHIIFIEEPEAHLHPQMQEVFIRKLDSIVKMFSEKFNQGRPWPVQFVVTTHSSYIANEAAFSSIRYFLARDHKEEGQQYFTTIIKDLEEGLDSYSATSGTKKKDAKKFLHQYMTLTKCDLLFADKAILIEGTTERILLPEMIKKTDASFPEDKQSLSSQYISVMEVGGAYAHIFYPLLNFLELKTLVITDLDSVKGKNGKKCLVREGERTSNGAIKNWFTEKTDHAVPALLSKNNADKIKGKIKITYQALNGNSKTCGRSFEDEFMICNPTLFSLNELDEFKKAEQAWEKAESVKKTDFALKHALESTEWKVPEYIHEGLLWLSEGVPVPPQDISEVIDAQATNTNLPEPIAKPKEKPTQRLPKLPK